MDLIHASYSVLSPAKINLRLEVIGKREDGYHNIFSVIQRVDLCDEIEIELGKYKGITLEVEGNYRLPYGRENLAWKAAEAFLNNTGINQGISITLHKRIPPSSGLGGGSSNAASILKVLNKTFGGPLEYEELFKIGRNIGADVPFFLLEGSAVAQGIGDILKHIELPEFWYVIVCPSFPISTREVYQSLNLGLTKKRLDINIQSLKNDLKDSAFLSRFLYNDLEKVSIKNYPQLETIKEGLKKCGAVGSLMSGSGSSIFGLFFKEREAREAYLKIKEEFLDKNWGFYISRGL